MSKHRSPSHPYISLPDAIASTSAIYAKEKRHPVPVDVLVKHCGYSDLKSSSALRLLSALSQYGLLDDIGRGEQRKMKISELGLDILLADSEQDAKKTTAIRRAATNPEVHAKIVAEFPDGLPSDGTLRSYLIRELDFNDVQVDLFIKKFRETIDFAGVYGNDLEPQIEAEKQSPQVGDYVQHRVNGVDQFLWPCLITEIIDDRGMKFALFDEMDVGAPMSELVVVDPPISPGRDSSERAAPRAQPPKNPRFQAPATSSKPISILVGYAEEGSPIYASISFDVPLRQGLLRRLGKQLTAMEKAAADESEDDSKDDE